MWYQEEEGERSDKWKDFLEQLARSPQPCSSEEEPKETLQADATECKAGTISERINEVDASSGRNSISDGSKESDPKEEALLSKETKTHKVQSWTQIKPSLGAIENMMILRVQKRKNMMDERENLSGDYLPSIEETEPSGGASEEELEGVEKTLDDNVNAVILQNAAFDEVSPKQLFPWMEELESLVRGGVPKDLRGEV